MAQFSVPRADRKKRNKQKPATTTRYHNNILTIHFYKTKPLTYIITNRYFCAMIETLMYIYESARVLKNHYYN